MRKLITLAAAAALVLSVAGPALAANGDLVKSTTVTLVVDPYLELASDAGVATNLTTKTAADNATIGQSSDPINLTVTSNYEAGYTLKISDAAANDGFLKSATTSDTMPLDWKEAAGDFAQIDNTPANIASTSDISGTENTSTVTDGYVITFQARNTWVANGTYTDLVTFTLAHK